MITITFSGVEELQVELDRRIELVHEQIENDIDWFGRTTTAEMIATHTFQNRTYRLETSIGYATSSFGVKLHGEVFATASYASEVEEGHPGARPYPFFYPVWFKWAPVVEEFFQTSLELALYDGEAANHA